ncbi:MAG: glycosyltransferase family 2 protein [Candidatus Buchananbacteria bacterium]
MEPTNQLRLSVIMPAFNEEASIINTINGLKAELAKLDLTYELIVVNDASTDQTVAKLKDLPQLKIINHPYNKGNGAALKTGARKASYDWLLFFDADGQQKPEYIKEMISYIGEFDLIAGQRTGYQGPAVRQPGKKLIHWLAIILLGQKIYDFNCGLRIINKKQFLRFAHILPDGFSSHTTIIFAFFKEKMNVKFVPVTINKRQGGKSMVKPKEAITYAMLIVRLIMLFSPLKIFLPISSTLFLLGLGMLVYDLFQFNVSKSTVLVLTNALIIFFFGLIADQVAALRREINKDY